jgi:hypothetical protein
VLPASTTSDDPAPGKVLTAIDTNGNAEWRTAAEIAGGQDCTLIADTWPSERATNPINYWTVPTPSICIDHLCAIHMFVYHDLNGDIYTVRGAVLRQFQTRQYSNDAVSSVGDSYWWIQTGSVVDGDACNYARNGSVTGCNSIVRYDNNSDNASTEIQLNDDLDATGTTYDELSRSNWSMKDNITGYWAEVYACKL